MSDLFVTNEFNQLEVMGGLLPPIFLGVAAFLLANDHYWLVLDKCRTANNSGVFAVAAVAMKFFKVSKYTFDVIKRIRTFGVTRELYALPGTQIRINFSFGLFNLLLNGLYFDAYVDFRLFRELLKCNHKEARATKTYEFVIRNDGYTPLITDLETYEGAARVKEDT